MPIPARFSIDDPPPELVDEMCALCDKIASASDEDLDELLARWHRHTWRKYEHHDFKNYWRSIDQDEFVKDALHPKPVFCDDLTYAEASSVMECFCAGGLPEDQTNFYLTWLEEQFPRSNMNDLIYWPDHWFGDASLFRDEGGAFKPEAELSVDQMLAYAMAKSSRHLPGAPSGVEMPFPLPTSDAN